MSDAVDPGITVTEIAPLDRPIDALPETTAAFVGRTLRGPLDTPVLVGNCGEFCRRFGGIWTRSSLGPAVRQFFDHGGRHLWIVRVASDAQGARFCLPASGSALLLRAVEPGSTERIRAAVDHDRVEQDTSRFNLTLQRIDPASGVVAAQESYPSICCEPGDSAYLVDALAGSGIAHVEEPLPARRPDVTLRGDSRYEPGWVDVPYQSGTDGSEISDYDMVGSSDKQTGIFALDSVDHLDLLYLPPRGRHLDPGPAAILAAERYCRRRNAMLIVDPPRDCTSAAAAMARVRDAGYASPNMLSYFPRARDNATATSGTDEGAGGNARPVGGALAGLMCRLDRQYGRWAGFGEGKARLAPGLVPAIDIDDDDRVMLGRAGFNVLERVAASRCLVAGSRTMARGTESHGIFGKLPVRRLCLQIVNAIDHATRWTVFQRTDQALADQLCERIGAYLIELQELGALRAERCSVQCEAGVQVRPEGTRAHGVTLLLTFHPRGGPGPVALTLHQDSAGLRVASTAFAPTANNHNGS